MTLVVNNLAVKFYGITSIRRILKECHIPNNSSFLATISEIRIDAARHVYFNSDNLQVEIHEKFTKSEEGSSPTYNIRFSGGWPQIQAAGTYTLRNVIIHRSDNSIIISQHDTCVIEKL